MKVNKNTTQVLKYWHRIEFFVPFDLDGVNAKYKITNSQLSEGNNHLLPWLSAEALKYAGGTFPFHYDYNLYLLPFDKNELTKISRRIFPGEQNTIYDTEFEERLHDEGKTCFAKLAINSRGVPDFENMAISTLPWAMGRLANGELDTLEYAYYKEEQNKLKSQFNLLNLHLSTSASEMITDKSSHNALTSQGLNFLLATLKKWAGFSPNDSYAVFIELIKLPPPKKNPQQGLSQPKLINEQTALPDGVSSDVLALTPKTLEESVEEQPEKLAQETFPILNSFYIEDLEKAINHVAKLSHKPIHNYIHGIDDSEKIDLYQQENHFYINQKTHPSYGNHGKWPTADHHMMSLMQQFAINEIFHSDKKSQIFSVNGPPGTGKTTLLQDIIAENIIHRAEILAGFSSAGDAFTGYHHIGFSNESKKIRTLDERLTGFEMVVVSSNNAAVENISKELPLKRKLADKYQNTCGYLTSVAAKVLAVHKQDKVIPLQEHDEPWGLISVALGNTKNRNQFRDRVFFSPEEEPAQEKNRLEAGKYLTIWEWKNQYHGPTFGQARALFITAKDKVEQYLEKIKYFIALDQTLKAIDLQSYYHEENVLLDSLVQNKAALSANKDKFLSLLAALATKKNQAHQNIQQQLCFKPNWLQVLFRSQFAKNYENKMTVLENQWSELIQQEKTFKDEINLLQTNLQKINNEIEQLENAIADKQYQYKQLLSKHQTTLKSLPDIVLPPADNNIETEQAQLHTFWQNPKLNELRANLFIAALTLHEAWLAEVLRYHAFSQNLIAISNLLQNKRPNDKADELYIWQSFFMWIPVISSTFASVAIQFKNLGPQTLGWVLIDEAGQATPQAAVGAIWRAKRILAVGDPLQIEPVFTTPINLVEGLAKHCLKTSYSQWLPTTASVQTLADAANNVGAYIINESQQRWIGCPLRVHRRCLEPMFSVANQIAYNNKMINARTDFPLEYFSILGNSCWHDVKGAAIDRQFVLEQGEFVLQLLVAQYLHQLELPKLFIITPFKRIKHKLLELITNPNNWKKYLTAEIQMPIKSHLDQWCRQHIGTVHTFQGKEANTVILVLGVDQKMPGAASWASSAPNLLNVAVTRAQNKIYVVGDSQLWASQPYFSKLAQALPILEQNLNL